MFVLLSPAKRLSLSASFEGVCTIPQLLAYSTKLWGSLQTLSPQEIETLMSVSSSIAKLNYDRFQHQSLSHLTTDTDNTPPCLLMFHGDAYRHLKAEDFTPSEWEVANRCLGVLSGLYGVLRPTDCIKPYRLEMKTQLSVGKHSNLYSFWGDKVNQMIEKHMIEQQLTTIINLASNEYSAVVKQAPIAYPIIDVHFKELRHGKLKTIAVNSKRARGCMARAIIKNDWQTPEDLHAFSDDGYQWSENDSSKQQLVFIRL